MSHSPAIFIDSADQLAEYLRRRLREDVKRHKDEEQCAKKRGDAAAAERAFHRWFHCDEACGRVGMLSEEFLLRHRAQVLARLIQKWPRIDLADDEDEAAILEAAE